MIEPWQTVSSIEWPCSSACFIIPSQCSNTVARQKVHVGEVDRQVLGVAGRAVADGLTQGVGARLVDHAADTFMDASTLAEAHHHFSEVGGTLQIRCTARSGRRLLAIGGLDDMLTDEA